ncbi:hypothetical protein BKA82DRAFT_4209387 [Pisolithus tinctorius]|nr:hypothetical protein BKA82DRAFT_4209387 [Pisolithus tinctorius]
MSYCNYTEVPEERAVHGGYDKVADVTRSDIDSPFELSLSPSTHPGLASMHIVGQVAGLHSAPRLLLDQPSHPPCVLHAIGGDNGLTQPADFNLMAETPSVGHHWELAAALSFLIASHPSADTFYPLLPAMWPAETIYTPPFTPTPGPSEPTPTTQAQNLCNPSTPQRTERSLPLSRDACFLPFLEMVPNTSMLPMQNLLPDPSVFPAAPFYAYPPTPTPGPSQTISTTQTQNPLTMPTPSTLSRVRRRTRGRQAPVSPDGKAVKYRSKNGELKNRLSICPAAACAVRFSRNEHLTRHVKCMHTDDEGWVCQYGEACKKTFTRKDNYRQHVWEDHPDQTWVNST